MPSDMNEFSKRFWLEEELDVLRGAARGVAPLEAESDEAFTERTARILAEALREAGANDSQALANALAPFIVKSIRTEIRNSRDEMADALYPVIGKAVRLYVAQAMEDLNAKIEASLPFDRWIKAIRAKFSGAPLASGYAAESSGFVIEGVYLIDRKSGALIARYPEPDPETTDAEMDEDLMSGMLAAILSFAEDAFSSEKPDALRRLSFVGSTLFLRASPGTIMAIRARGTPPKDIAARLDVIFEQFLTRWTQIRDGDSPQNSSETSRLLENLRAETTQAADQSPGKNPLMVVLAFVAAIGCGWVLHRGANDIAAERARTKVESAVFADAALTGYPLKVVYSAKENLILVEGLGPTQDALAALQTRVEAVAPNLQVRYALQAIPRLQEPE